MNRKHKQVIIRLDCRLTWLQHTHIVVGTSPKWIPPFVHHPRSQPEKTLRAKILIGNLSGFTTKTGRWLHLHSQVSCIQIKLCLH